MVFIWYLIAATLRQTVATAIIKIAAYIGLQCTVEIAGHHANVTENF